LIKEDDLEILTPETLDVKNVVMKNRPIPFCKVLKLADLEKLINSTHQSMQQAKDANYRNLLDQKIKILEQELSEREQEGESNTNFVGFYSYDFKLSPVE